MFLMFSLTDGRVKGSLMTGFRAYNGCTFWEVKFLIVSSSNFVGRIRVMKDMISVRIRELMTTISQSEISNLFIHTCVHCSISRWQGLPGGRKRTTSLPHRYREQ